MAAIIKTEHLTHVYGEGMPDATTALDDINIEIEEGEFVGVIGSTGSGKSTLITHFNGILKPTSGKVYVDGRDIWADPGKIREFRFLVGLVFQYPEYQLFEETVAKERWNLCSAQSPSDHTFGHLYYDRRFHSVSAFIRQRKPLLDHRPKQNAYGQAPD